MRFRGTFKKNRLLAATGVELWAFEVRTKEKLDFWGNQVENFNEKIIRWKFEPMKIYYKSDQSLRKSENITKFSQNIINNRLIISWFIYISDYCWRSVQFQNKLFWSPIVGSKYYIVKSEFNRWRWNLGTRKWSGECWPSGRKYISHSPATLVTWWLI